MSSTRSWSPRPGLDEHRAKLSAAMKGKKGRPVSLQTRAKISAALKGKKRKPRAS